MNNRVDLTGRLGKDVELRSLDGGSKVATLSLATWENRKNDADEWEQQTEWHNVVLWNKVAEYASKHLMKGMRIQIIGKLCHRSYDDKNGNKRYISEVIASKLIPIDKKEPPNESQNNRPQQSSHSSGEEATDNDLPF